MNKDKRFSASEFIEKMYLGKDKDERYKLLMQIAFKLEARTRMFDILFNDTKAAMKGSLKQPANPYMHRTLVRTLFATIEGSLSLMKQDIIIYHYLQACKLTNNDLRKLVDESKVLGGIFILELKPQPLKLKENLKYTFKKYSLLPGKSLVKIDAKSKEWDSFCKSIKLRNKLTHPKTEKELLLTEDQMIYVMNAWNWFSDILIEARNHKY